MPKTSRREATTRNNVLKIETFRVCWLWNVDPFKTSKRVQKYNAFNTAQNMVCARCDELLCINTTNFKVRANCIRNVSQNAKCNTALTLPT